MDRKSGDTATLPDLLADGGGAAIRRRSVFLYPQPPETVRGLPAQASGAEYSCACFAGHIGIADYSGADLA